MVYCFTGTEVLRDTELFLVADKSHPMDVIVTDEQEDTFEGFVTACQQFQTRYQKAADELVDKQQKVGFVIFNTSMKPYIPVLPFNTKSEKE